MKICLGVPNGGRVHARLLTDLVQSVMTVPGASWFLCAPEGSLGPHNRWIAARMAVEEQCEYLWLVDADMAIPPDALPRLLAHHKDLVGAAYHYRGLPLRTVVKLRDQGGALYIPDKLPDTLFSCAAIGSGCTLVRVSALQQIPQPWFALAWTPEGCLAKTDDVWFCEQAASVGIETWCDPSLEVRHIGDFLY